MGLERGLRQYRAAMEKLNAPACEAAAAELYWTRHDLPCDPRWRAKRRAERRLLGELARLGVKGDPRRRALYTRSRPRGCRVCLKGKGACLSVTNLCTRDCFFCPNPRPRADRVALGGYPIDEESHLVRVVERFGLESIGISGGDPLTRLDRTARLALSLRRRFGPGFWMQLYTNGDLLSDEALRRLRRAGINELRIDLAAYGFDLRPVRRALDGIGRVTIELPVIPEHEARLKRLIGELDALGARHLVLHELGCAAANRRSLARRGYLAKSPRQPTNWMRPVSDSGLAALRLLKHALRTTRRMSVYFCSHDTIEMINRRGVRYRLSRLRAPTPARLDGQERDGGRGQRKARRQSSHRLSVHVEAHRGRTARLEGPGAPSAHAGRPDVAAPIERGQPPQKLKAR